MKLRVVVCIFLFWAMALQSVAQEIKWNDIKTIQLNTPGMFDSDNKRIVEVLPEGKVWNVYQLFIQGNKPKFFRDSTRRLIKTVSITDLQRLLAYINKPDTILKPELFNITTEELVQYIDTVQFRAKKMLQFAQRAKADSIAANLTEKQRQYFIDVITTKQLVKDAILKALHGFEGDGAVFLQMVFTHKDNRRDTLDARMDITGAYDLPWKLKDILNFNPRITELFNAISGNEKANIRERNKLIYRIDYLLYIGWVDTRIYWDAYKAKQPANYASLNKTLAPMDSFADGKRGYFKSDLLPFNIQLAYSFMKADTLNTAYYNAVEKDMINHCRKGGFLFDYLKEHPTYIAFVYCDVSAKTIDEIKAIYPAITKYSASQIKRFYIAGDYYQSVWYAHKSSGWLLLPDGTTILIRVGDQLLRNNEKIFAGLATKTGHGTRGYCIVFDKNGQRIAGDNTEVRIDW